MTAHTHTHTRVVVGFRHVRFNTSRTLARAELAPVLSLEMLLTTTPLQLVLSLSPFVVQRPALAPRRTAAPRCCAGGGGPTDQPTSALEFSSPDQPTPATDFSGPESYSSHWEQLLRREYRETAEQLREKRAKWSRGRLEASGLAVFGASATPETE